MQGLGRYQEALVHLRRARQLDPLIRVYLFNLLHNLAVLRRKEEWMAEAASVRQEPGRAAASLAWFWFKLTGELPAQLNDEQEIIRAPRATDRMFLVLARNFDGALKRISTILDNSNLSAGERWGALLQKADCLRWLGRNAEADATLHEAGTWMERANAIADRDASIPDQRRMMTWARVGRSEEAVAAGRRFVAAASSERQQEERWLREVWLATVHALLGQTRECVALLDRLLKVPSGITVPMLKVDPIWDRVRDDPGFKALLEDPRNSAPL